MSKQRLFEIFNKINGTQLILESDFPKPKYGIHGNNININWDNINDEYKPIITWAVDNIMNNLDDTTLNKLLMVGGKSSFHNKIQNNLGELTKNFIENVDDNKLTNIYQSNNVNGLYNLFINHTLSTFDSFGQGEMEDRFNV